MTERDTGATTNGDGRRSTDAHAEPNDPMVPPPSVPSAFGSTPAGWQPTAAPTPAVPSASAVEPTSTSGAAPTTGSVSMPTVPSRRSLRGKPPVSTAAIPVVPAAQRPVAAPHPTADAAAPDRPVGPEAPVPPAPSAPVPPAPSAPAPSTAAPARRPAWSRTADAEPASGPTWAPTSAPTSPDTTGWASAAATIPTDAAVTRSTGEPFTPDLAFGSTGASPLPNRSATPPTTDEDVAPFTPDLALGSAPLPSRAPAPGTRPGAVTPVSGPVFDPPSGTAPTVAGGTAASATGSMAPDVDAPSATAPSSDRPGTSSAGLPETSATVSAATVPADVTSADTAPRTGQLPQLGQPTPAPAPAWHPVTGQIPVVADTAAPWKPVTGQQPLVAEPEQPVTTPATEPAAMTAEPITTEATGPSAVTGATAPFPAAPAIDASNADTEHSEEPVTPPRRNRRALWITLIIVGVLVLGGAGAGAWYLFNRDEPAPEQQVVQAPSPTSALTAVDRTATSAFAATLPATVLQYALTGSQDDPEWVAAGAIESYLDTYADEAGDQLTVHSGQWATAAEAQAQQTAVAAALTGEVISSGAVTVSGADAGMVTVVDLGDGTGTAVWSNSTAVFVLTAPLADVSNAFAAYPV